MGKTQILNSAKTIKQIIGSKGEDAAVSSLESKGFAILKRNYTVHNVGEIDIIAEKENDIYVFEVRTRLNRGPYPDSAESVIRSKRNKVIRTAARFIDEKGYYDRNIIFEVIKVTHDEQGNVQEVEFVPF
ncbi:MAG: YraN family protein [Clostridiales bacterium]|nr:YraN family protein [Clostridiales bacterium]